MRFRQWVAQFRHPWVLLVGVCVDGCAIYMTSDWTSTFVPPHWWTLPVAIIGFVGLCMILWATRP